MKAWTILLLSIVQAGSAAVYVDAEGGIGGNTVHAVTASPLGWYIEGTAVDQLWGRRAFGNDADANLGTALPADVFEATTTGGIEDCASIKTTISGLNPGWIYGVSVVYWSQGTNQNWAIRAGFSPDNLALYARTASGGVVAGTLTGRTQGDRIELRAFLGRTAADASGQIAVYVDDKPSTTDYTERTWYDGLTYEAEPGAPVCQSRPAYDFSGPEGEPDCKVDLYDFAEFARAWMQCNLIPESACIP